MSSNDRQSKRRKIGHDERRVQSDGIALPFGAKCLGKDDLPAIKSLLGKYLDVQKEIDINTLDDREVKGRWKSFLGKWNRGELNVNWYAPKTNVQASKDVSDDSKQDRVADADGDDDEFGPSLPQSAHARPAAPTQQDLQYRDEMNEGYRTQARMDRRDERKNERKRQKERMEEIAPKAEAGTKERQLEKKREKADANRSYREARSPGAEDVREGDLMGEDGIAEYQAAKKADEKRKTEREIRKEEMLRARAAEREERLQVHRAKEDKTMEMFKAIAKERFG